MADAADSSTDDERAAWTPSRWGKYIETRWMEITNSEPSAHPASLAGVASSIIATALNEQLLASAKERLELRDAEDRATRVIGGLRRALEEEKQEAEMFCRLAREARAEVARLSRRVDALRDELTWIANQESECGDPVAARCVARARAMVRP